MKKLVIATTLLTLGGVCGALAKDKCSVPSAEWQPEKALRDKLAATQKWTIKKIEEDDGCYEVYGTDDKGQKVKAYYNPKTLEPLVEAKS